MALGCGHDTARSDYSHEFLGVWECDSGQRQIDCGQGIINVDLASGQPPLLQFTKGSVTDLALSVPSRALVPGLPGGPSCALALDTTQDVAFMSTESVCSDDDGQDIIVQQAMAESAWRADELTLTTAATTSQQCRITNTALCYATH